MLLAALYSDYANEDLLDMDESELYVNDDSAAEPSMSPSTSPPPDMHPGSLRPSQPEPMCPSQPQAEPMCPISVTQLICLAGGLGLAAAISAADAHTDSFGPDWEVPSERESRRIALTPAGARKRCTANCSAGTGSGSLGRARVARDGEARACMAGRSMPRSGSGGLAWITGISQDIYRNIQFVSDQFLSFSYLYTN